MSVRIATLSLCLVGLAAPAACLAEGSVPLQLALRADEARPVPANKRHAMGAPANRAPVAVNTPGIGRQAMQSLLSAPDTTGANDAAIAGDASAFRFKRAGNVGRNLGQGYKDMCDNVSRKVWDDPAGKRVRFDVSGKPGIAFEIPLH